MLNIEIQNLLMNKHIRIIALLLFCFSFSTALKAQCPAGYDLIKVELLTDNYPQETSWNLYSNTGAILLSSQQGMAVASFYADSICVPTGTCVKFIIQDSYGDGICCNYGIGHYTLSVNGAVADSGGQFTYSATSYVNCPPGSYCSDAFTAYQDTIYNSVGASTWYEFTPDSTGMFNISACFPNNTCNTRLWVYDHCNNLVWDSLQYGTIYFNDDACGIQSYLPAGLQAGQTYYIRVGGDSSCIDSNITWQITYGGPVVGCMDSTACNFNPLASIDNNTCIYPGDPNCNHGPDLVVDQNILRNSLYVSSINGNDVCLIGEGCTSGYGQRDIINFSTRILNNGDQDYYIGPPQTGNSQFVYDNCHGHWHYAGYAKYELYDSLQNEMQVGFKNGFCVLDLMCFTGTAKYGCGNMGISAGCADEYSSGLSCQWIDITDVPDGKYTLVVKVNWDQSPDKLGHVETDYSNNVAYMCFNLSRATGNIVATLNSTPSCVPIVDCLGDTFGLAKKDCIGDCNGSRLSGDWDIDADRDSIDLINYCIDIVNLANVTPCNDLNGDNKLTVTDAAKLNGCVRDSAGTHTHPNGTSITHSHCDFPKNLKNVLQTVYISIDSVNTQNKFIDVAIANPDGRLLGVDFHISGLIIDSIKNISPLFNPYIAFVPSNGRVVALAIDEASLTKQTVAVPMFRVYYQSTTSSLVCIDDFYSAVNSDYEEANHAIVNGCVTINTTGIGYVSNSSLLTAAPNPFKNTINVNCPTFNGQKVMINIVNPLGQIIQTKTVEHFNSRDYQLETGNLPEGVYFLEVKNDNITLSTRIIKVE